MSDRFNQTIACVVLSSCCFAPSAYAQSNSKGENSSVVVGILKEVNAAGKEFKVLQAGELLRELHTDSKSKVYFSESEMPLTQCTRDVTGWPQSLRNKHFIKRNA